MSKTNQNRSRDTRRKRIQIETDGHDPRSAVVTGRVLWALEQLMEGPCTPITRPAPRWSDYVFRLRGEGVHIETEHEPHDGPYPGTHAKYHLRSKVTFLEIEEGAA